MLHAIIRAEKMPVVKEQLRNIGIGGMTVSSVSGWSRQRELHLQWRGQPVSYDLVPRMKFEIAVPDERVELVIRTIVKHARSGESGEQGDGIIFLSSIEQSINIATLEEGERSLT
ncbi:MAG TPA: P-II family nitrogen regulator [Nitrososphaeraceae archaeon]|jgi:nitrogen regulatory protein P-II 1|nr:P-II family nitrogen regulator [Nitrososphaeraceae archaeon]